MTLPFENNTTQVVKRLAKRSLSSEKRRNVLLVITIALAAFLMSTVGTAIFSTGAMQRKMAEDTYEIVYSLITEEDLQNLRQQPEIERAGLQYALGTDDNNDTGGLVSMSYGDEDTLYAARKQSEILEGTYPQTVDEAAVSSSYLEKFFPGSGVGDQITVPFEGKEYPFTVSAILSSPDTGVEAYSVMVSQSFLKEQPGYDPGKYNAYVHFKEADSYKADDLKPGSRNPGSAGTALRVVQFHLLFHRPHHSAGRNSPVGGGCPGGGTGRQYGHPQHFPHFHPGKNPELRSASDTGGN